MKFLKQIKIKNILMLTIAGIVNAIGVTMFLAPVKLYDSGISGTSMLLGQLTPDWMSLSLFLAVLNIPIFLFGAKKQGWVFTVYAVYVVAIYSLSAWLITDVLPIDVSFLSPFAKDDLFLCAVFGGLISGAGSGIAVTHGWNFRNDIQCYFVHRMRNYISQLDFAVVFHSNIYCCTQGNRLHS